MISSRVLINYRDVLELVYWREVSSDTLLKQSGMCLNVINSAVATLFPKRSV